MSTADNVNISPADSGATSNFYDMEDILRGLEQSLDGYTSHSPTSQSGDNKIVNEFVENMERDFTMLSEATETPHDVTMMPSTASSSLQGARGPKSRRVEVGYQSLSVVVKTESLCLVGATWAYSQFTRPNGAVVGVWKHQLPDPSAAGAPARLDQKDQLLFSPNWKAGDRGNQPFICATVKAVHSIKPYMPIIEIRQAVKAYFRSMSGYYAKQDEQN